MEEALGEASHQHRQVVFEPELVIRQSSLARRQDRQRQDRPRKAPPAEAPAATAPAATAPAAVTEAAG
jgi:hypothetical protein